LHHAAQNPCCPTLTLVLLVLLLLRIRPYMDEDEAVQASTAICYWVRQSSVYDEDCSISTWQPLAGRLGARLS
jgi:hypothetical protein